MDKPTKASIESRLAHLEEKQEYEEQDEEEGKEDGNFRNKSP
jgi:hypothetical protein